MLGRMLGRDKVETAVVEIHNALASVPLEELTREAVLAPLVGAGVAPERARARLVGIYADALRSFVADGRVNADERATLLRLRELLGLELEDVAAAHEEFVFSLFARACAAALADGRLTGAERARLDQIASDLGIDADLRASIYEKQAKPVLLKALSDAAADGRLTPAEDAELVRLAGELGVQLPVDRATRELFDRLRWLGRIAEGEIPSVPVPISLKRGEICGAAVWARHAEIRTVTVGRTYSGLSYSSKAVFGVRYRSGYNRSHAITADQLVELDAGTLYLTSSRLLFTGARKNTQIPLSKILGAMFYTNGIQVSKETGKDAWFLMDADIEYLRAVFDAIMLRSRL